MAVCGDECPEPLLCDALSAAQHGEREHAGAPRAQGEEASQKPQIRNAGMIVSFVFELAA